MAGKIIPLALLVTPFSPSLFTGDSCLVNSYYGTFGGNASVFLTDRDCLSTISPDLLLPASMALAPPQTEQLVWIEEKVVETSLKSDIQPFSSKLDALVDRLLTSSDFSPRHQDVFTFPAFDTDVHILYRAGSFAILSMSQERARIIDLLLPRFWKSTLFPRSPVLFRPVPPEALGHIKHVLSTLKFNPDVAAIVNNISIPQLREDIRFLTGENGESGIISRHSFSDGSKTAAAWLKKGFEATGAECELKHFLLGFAPNVVCRYPSTVNTTTRVLLGAHYDSRGSFGSIRAPGGNDDGSGTISLLAIARTIHRRGLTFRSNVELVAFAGEEQGLLGSRAYSRELRLANSNITLMIQSDMTAYHVPGEPPQLGLPRLFEIPELAQLLANISIIYSPELTVGFTMTCCSDHQSFYEAGFPATQLFERAGPIADPMYHNSGDLSDREGYDIEQVKSIAKVQFAALLHTAGFDFPL